MLYCESRYTLKCVRESLGDLFVVKKHIDIGIACCVARLDFA